MDTSVQCQCNADFSQQLSKPLKFSSYLGRLVSVQASSGAILGCGRFESHFPVYARYKKHIVFRQYSPHHLTSLMLTTNLDIFQYTVMEGIANTCSGETAIFNPWKESVMKIGPRETPDQFPVGDLSNRQVGLYNLQAPLIGSATILGHAVCTVHDFNCLKLL